MDEPPILLHLPDPSLVVLVAAAGAGKSTFARRRFAADEILSSDAFRAIVAGDPADQGATRAAFAALHRALARRLAAGRLTVVDATSVTPAAREALVREATRAGVPAVAIVLDLPPAVVHARNAARPGAAAVPFEAVERQLAALARALEPGRLAREGFAATWRLRDPADVERVRVVRVRRGPG